MLFDVDWNPANDLQVSLSLCCTRHLTHVYFAAVCYHSHYTYIHNITMAEQAMARVWRDGQRSTTYVYRLLATNTIEERMYQRQISKQGLSGVVVDLKDSEAKGLPLFSSDQLKELFSPVLDTSVCLSTTHKMLSCNCTSSGDSASNKPTADLSITDDDFNFDMDFNVEFPSKQQVRPCQLLAPKVLFGKFVFFQSQKLCISVIYSHSFFQNIFFQIRTRRILAWTS